MPFLLLAACEVTTPEDSGEAASARLRAVGTQIVDGAGTPVVLRGVALGGWNFHENWITAVDYPAHGRLHVIGEAAGVGTDVDAVLTEVGENQAGDADWLAAVREGLEGRLGVEVTDALLAELAEMPSIVDDSDLGLRLVLEDRFGVDGRDTLLDEFQGGWITEADIAWIADQGFNVVRVPMGWRGLTSLSDHTPPTELVWNEKAFARVDSLLDWCETHGIYAVLDVQEAPGGQNEYAAPSTLYEDPAMQALTVELWQELSRRYKDRDSVAAYSLLAEPMSAPDATARDAMYDQLVKAIRAEGDDHLLVIHDGFRGLFSLPLPGDMGWEGVVYSTHLFEWGASSEEEYIALLAAYDELFSTTQANHGVPYYIGSFSTFKDEAWAYASATHMVKAFEARQWAWTVWTYKRIDDPIETALFGTTTAWGVRGRLATDFARPDLYVDDEATLATKMAGYADIQVDPNAELLTAITSGF